MTCRLCPAYVWVAESLATGLCHGCRSGPPAIRLDAAPAKMAVAHREPAMHGTTRGRINFWLVWFVLCGVLGLAQLVFYAWLAWRYVNHVTGGG